MRWRISPDPSASGAFSRLHEFFYRCEALHTRLSSAGEIIASSNQDDEYDWQLSNHRRTQDARSGAWPGYGRNRPALRACRDIAASLGKGQGRAIARRAGAVGPGARFPHRAAPDEHRAAARHQRRLEAAAHRCRWRAGAVDADGMEAPGAAGLGAGAARLASAAVQAPLR